MKSVHVRAPGGPEMLSLVETPVPSPGPGEVLIRVAAAGVNRPDIQQRRGLYPPPPGASPVLGLDIAGVVQRIGEGVNWPRPGEAVCALANGGGYAEYCNVPAVQCMPIPNGFGFVEAAALRQPVLAQPFDFLHETEGARARHFAHVGVLGEVDRHFLSGAVDRRVVEDDGKGFDARETRNGVGLTSVESRVQMLNGSLSIDTSPQNGTFISIFLPLDSLN